jgi:hypothetical protein
VGFRFVIYSFYNVEVHSCIPNFLKDFIMNW